MENSDERLLMTKDSEAIAYVVCMFASDPAGFLDNGDGSTTPLDELIKKQYNIFKSMCKKHKVDFKTAITSWSKGKLLYSKYK